MLHFSPEIVWAYASVLLFLSTYAPLSLHLEKKDKKKRNVNTSNINTVISVYCRRLVITAGKFPIKMYFYKCG